MASWIIKNANSYWSYFTDSMRLSNTLTCNTALAPTLGTEEIKTLGMENSKFIALVKAQTVEQNDPDFWK